ncbi:MAG: DUF6600 domain-containing protein [Candidatus Aminicenantales bacterium]
MRKFTGILTALLILGPLLLLAEEPAYTNYSFARLSYITGDIFIQRAADLGYEPGKVNMPIAEGDRLGTTEGRGEIYLGRGNYLRLDHNTKIDFLKLPDKNSDLTQFQLWSGNIYLSLKTLTKEKSLQVHTPDVSIYFLTEGLYRIDVSKNRETEILVFNGLVEAAGETGSVLIKDAQRLEVTAGRFGSQPSKFIAVAEDSFDRWSEARDSQIRQQIVKHYLPEELEDFQYELDAYGDWAYVPPYGYVWVPGGIDPSWRPYYNGRWLWLPLSGWTWLPYEPWGWVTFHFGRWHWSIGLGWYWIPTTIWGPAWVSWYWGYDYLGWVPLSYYNYPVVIINNVFYPRYNGSFYPYNSRVLTVINRNQLQAPNVAKVSLSSESLKNVGKIKLTSSPPSIKPPRGKVILERMGGHKIFLKKKETSSPPFQNSVSTRFAGSRAKSSLPAVTKENSISRTGASPQRKTIKNNIGYPSSPEISLEKYLKTRKSESPLSRIYRYITGSRKYIKSSYPARTSPRGFAAKKTISKSSSSSARLRKSSSAKRTSSRSSKTKKKK